jgi:4-hydroxy-L-threonine phosphate dehydrogenase PdxA
MIDLTAIDPAEVIAKGQYSIVRAAHEEAKKRLAVLCGQFAGIAPQVLRLAQPENDDVPIVEVIAGMFTQGHALLDQMQGLVVEIEALAMQRSTLKSEAWGKRP